MTETKQIVAKEYFLYGLPILKKYWDKMEVPLLYKKSTNPHKFFNLIFSKTSILEDFHHLSLSSSDFFIFSMLNRAYRHIIYLYADVQQPKLLEDIMRKNKLNVKTSGFKHLLTLFINLFPGKPFLESNITVEEYIKRTLTYKSDASFIIKEMLLLYISEINPATTGFRLLFNTQLLSKKTKYRKIMQIILHSFDTSPEFSGLKSSLSDILLSPIKRHPNSLYEQLLFVIEKYGFILPDDLLSEAVLAIDIYKEEHLKREFGPAEAKVIEFEKRDDSDLNYEPELFTPDRTWMTNVVLIAKMVYVWLYQLSKKYNREISRLDQIPDEELDQIANRGINAIWLIGVWKRSQASQNIKHILGNTDAIASAYSLYNYQIAEDLGGIEALLNLKERAAYRGIRLASDMVPNHTGIYSEWILQHPDWFIQTDELPYPNYTFTGKNLSPSDEISIYIEDGYWSKTDAAVVFKYVNNATGQVRYIYHGNDGTSTPWNDTAQLNYLLPEVREAVIKTILSVAKLFPIIRFDAAMTLTKRHYQRLWFPLPGHGGAIPSRAHFSMTRGEFDKHMPNEFWREVVDRVNMEAPDTLLLAEAFWLMEGYFVRTLGMHRVYNSAFMNMLKMEENSKYRKTIKNVVEFDPEILKRFVNFMNNPDEKTAVEQFGKEKKYFGAAVMLATMPGLPMFGHGQIEGFQEKYGMEYKRCYWNEKVDEKLVKEHENKIFPLLKKRWLFSGSDNFVFYDFYKGATIDENVFVYSNTIGEEKAIVIYHNKFASTEGWFKTSTPFLKKDRGNAYMVKKSLPEAFSIKDDENVFYIFRDYSNYLYYIRNGKELCEKGMYAVLNAYDYHVFMDFQEITDDAERHWKKVHDYLAGQGDENIFDLFKIVKYNHFLSLFRKLFKDINWLIDSLFEKEKDKKPGYEELSKIIYEIADTYNVSTKPEEIKNTITAFEFYSKNKRLLLPLYNKDISKLLSFRFVLDLLNFSKLKLLEDDQYGVIPYIRREKILDIEGLDLLDELKICMTKNILGIKENYRFKEECHKLFQEECIKKFINVNLYNETLWFNKEKFEAILFFLYAVAAKEKITLPPNTSVASTSVITRRLKNLLEASAKANYQHDKILSIITGN